VSQKNIQESMWNFRNIWQRYYWESKQSNDAIFSPSPN